jgi:hypothetical protein
MRPQEGTYLAHRLEDKANGSAVIQMLQHEIPGILPVNPEGGKVAPGRRQSAHRGWQRLLAPPRLCAVDRRFHRGVRRLPQRRG